MKRESLRMPQGRREVEDKDRPKKDRKVILKHTDTKTNAKAKQKEETK